jgi:hypothetical protein
MFPRAFNYFFVRKENTMLRYLLKRILVLVMLLLSLGVDCVYTIPPPPPPAVSVMSPRPYPEAVWVGGYWRWGRWRHRYVWVPGHWQVRRGRVWVIVR